MERKGNPMMENKQEAKDKLLVRLDTYNKELVSIREKRKKLDDREKHVRLQIKLINAEGVGLWMGQDPASPLSLKDVFELTPPRITGKEQPGGDAQKADKPDKGQASKEGKAE